MKKTGVFREFFESFKRRKPAQIFCPRCASSKIHLSSSLDFWLTPKNYVCDSCGYSGLVVMELEKEEEAKETA